VRDAELSPEQEEQVRRLLAQVRHDEPIPDGVADRLDRVLADLSHESRGQPAAELAPVVDLAARRRRRHVAALLAGAAAVIVGGFAVGQMIDVGGGDGASDSAASQPVDRHAAGGSANDESLGTPSPGATGNGTPLSHASPSGLPLKLSSARLPQDLADQLPGVEDDRAFAASAPQAAETFGCQSAPASAYGRGRFLPAYYDGVPAVVALRPPAHNAQRADVLECGTAQLLGSAIIGGR
jgi:hypothetical protein